MAMGALMLGIARFESRTLPMAYLVAPLKPGTLSQLLKFLKAAKRTNSSGGRVLFMHAAVNVAMPLPMD